MNPFLNFLLKTSLLVVALFIVGCGPSIPRNHLSGTVTFDGKPVPKGLIYFNPVTKRGEKTPPQGMARIIDGKYNTADHKGILPGKYKVNITGFSGGDQPTMLFQEYVIDLDVTSEMQTKDFDVPKSAAEGLSAEPFQIP